MRVYALKKIDKFIKHYYSVLIITTSSLTGIGLGVVMLVIEKILK